MEKTHILNGTCAGSLEKTGEKTRGRRRGLAQTVGLLMGTVALGLWMPRPAIAQTTKSSLEAIDQLNIFGDSLSDAGNIFTLSQGTFPPSPPYAQRLSNGPVWVEVVAAELGLAPELSANVVPSILSGVSAPPANGINFAIAGSLSSDINVGGPILPGLQQQIVTFSALSQAGLPPSDDALHVLLAGGNDYNEAILSATSIADVANLADQVTDNVVGATSALFKAGAKNVLVSNLPALDMQPFADSVDQFNPLGSSILNALSSEHNQRLEQKLTALISTLDPLETKLTQFDLSSVTTDIITNPTAFGLENSEDSCLTDFQIDGRFTGICANPDKFFFWDDVHPTAAGHSLIAQAALESLAGDTTGGNGAVSVPEPSGMMALFTLSGMLWLSGRKRHERSSCGG